MFQAPMDQGQRYDVGVRVPSGDLSWGDLAGLRQLFGRVAYIPNVEADPRRKLPGGQSSPQSLRGMASIVCRYGKVRVDELFAHGWLYLLQRILRHRSQLDAEAMALPFSAGLFHVVAHSLWRSVGATLMQLFVRFGIHIQEIRSSPIHALRHALQHARCHSSSTSLILSSFPSPKPSTRDRPC
jgi:hypothetical protein